MNAEIDPKTVHTVTNTDELAAALTRIRQADEVAIDTESDSLFVYYEKVCLIQITALGESYVIDPLETGNLAPLGEIFADPKVLKIFHAAEYDIMCLKRDYGFTFVNLFDTMQAARILGRKEVGLGALVENEFGIHLDKKYQKSNWGIRPLSKEMLKYAVCDTRFLSALKDRFSAELEERGLSDLAAEDFKRLCRLPAGSSEPIESVWWKVAGGVELDKQQIAVLQSLCEFREEAARRRDLPPFKVMSGKGLVSIAVENPQNERALRSIKGLGRTVIDRYGKDLLSINRNSRSSRKKVPMPPIQVHPSNGILSRRERLKNWRRDTGLEMDLPSDVILPRELMDTIAETGPETTEQLRELMKDCPARYRRFGDRILSISTNGERK